MIGRLWLAMLFTFSSNRDCRQITTFYSHFVMTTVALPCLVIKILIALNFRTWCFSHFWWLYCTAPLINEFDFQHVVFLLCCIIIVSIKCTIFELGVWESWTDHSIGWSTPCTLVTEVHKNCNKYAPQITKLCFWRRNFKWSNSGKTGSLNKNEKW